MATLNVTTRQLVMAQNEGLEPAFFVKQLLIQFQMWYGHGELPVSVHEASGGKVLVHRFNVQKRNEYWAGKAFVDRCILEFDRLMAIGADKLLAKEEAILYMEKANKDYAGQAFKGGPMNWAQKRDEGLSLKPPSKNQIQQLKHLDYVGEIPKTRLEAMRIIGAIVAKRLADIDAGPRQYEEKMGIGSHRKDAA